MGDVETTIFISEHQETFIRYKKCKCCEKPCQPVPDWAQNTHSEGKSSVILWVSQFHERSSNAAESRVCQFCGYYLLACSITRLRRVTLPMWNPGCKPWSRSGCPGLRSSCCCCVQAPIAKPLAPTLCSCASFRPVNLAVLPTASDASVSWAGAHQWSCN